MSIFDKIFGVKEKKPEAGSAAARREYDEMLNQMVGVSETSKVSNRGHPVCPKCGYEFPWTETQIEERGQRFNVLHCPKCQTESRFRKDVE